MSQSPGPIRTFANAITRNGVSLAGAALTTAAALLFFALFAIESLGFEGGPYLGIITFVVVPVLFVTGLAFIPAGIYLQRRRARRAALRGEPAPRLPVIDLNVDRTRTMVVVFSGATMLNLVILGVATYKSVEVMETVQFCGASCHSVMNPEYTTYQHSPHSRVACVNCHIGPGAGWFVKSKLSGSWQLISVNLKLYPKPIPTPVHNLRPARDTCEQCHWPNKFVGDRLKVITHYEEDERNTEVKTVLLLRVGGQQGRASKGIHWHVDPGVRIRYQSDEKREVIRAIELTRADGSVSTFKTPAPKDAPEGASEGEPENQTASETWRTMDCIDCHNRPSHIYRMPQAEVDRAMAEGRIDKTIPFVRREGLRALQGEYTSQDEARAKIADTLAAFYQKEQPSVDGAKIDAAARELGQIYSDNVFPSMNIKWGTYPNHLGHMDSPGCFRCHDGEHVDQGGQTISQDCDTCHTVLAMDEQDPAVLKTLQP
jgi:nitrate/TMAO reductase-like tetraheme cytochrome c subunit